MDRETFEKIMTIPPASSPCMICNFQEINAEGVCCIRAIWEYPVGWAEMLDEGGEQVAVYLQVEPTPPAKVS